MKPTPDPFFRRVVSFTPDLDPFTDIKIENNEDCYKKPYTADVNKIPNIQITIFIFLST
jgi:hypothetical protein